jgi:formylglycine-generating enzyme required for sulfatase activity
MLMSMRTDFLGELQKDESLFKVHQKIDVPPLREAELRKVVNCPAELLSARFETAELVDIITRRTAEDSVKGVGALPLLSYTLDDMWTQMVKRGDGVLRLPAQSFELGGVLSNRADAFLAENPKSHDELRRIFTLKLATVREGEEPTRRRALRSEFSDEEWRLVSELADHPNRLLVTATPESGEPYAEVAHEAIFRRWHKLRDWIAAEREFLAWRTGLEAAQRAWLATPDRTKKQALLMGLALTQAQFWLGERSDGLSKTDRDFIVLSRRTLRRQKLRGRTLIGFVSVFLLPLLSVLGWMVYHSTPQFWDITTSVLTAQAEQALRPGDTFKECASCPEMVVVPAGSFIMGSPKNEAGRQDHEGPQRKVTIRQPFAVGKFEITSGEWRACYGHSGCKQYPMSLASGRTPVTQLSWMDVKQYVAWLSRVTGKSYRLLTEAEWEYAARAGQPERFSFGDDETKLDEYGWDRDNSGGSPQPVGQKKPNAFGLYDTYGNVFEWVEDCYKADYNAAPTDGLPLFSADCSERVFRGGSYLQGAKDLRSAHRWKQPEDGRFADVGFRVARKLNP